MLYVQSQEKIDILYENCTNQSELAHTVSFCSIKRKKAFYAIVWLSFLRLCYGKENIGYFGMYAGHTNDNGIGRLSETRKNFV